MRCFALTIILLVVLFSPFTAYCEHNQNNGQTQQQPGEGQRLFDAEVELDAYYTNVELFLPLTKTPIPHLGEKNESEIYYHLLSQSLLPRFIVLEASIHPMPYLGVYIKKHEDELYDDAQVSGSFNVVKAVTKGFEEPYAWTGFIGNVVDFDTAGQKDTKGKGFVGFILSAGNYHIKDNELVEDCWREIEWKIKGDRKSPVKKLSWSFRVGTKLHSNAEITDTVYASFRRGRVDYKPSGSSLFNNSGFEYTFDMDYRFTNALRHYFYVDKKWPFKNKRMAFSLALGFVEESPAKYSGKLADERGGNDFQIILRPNIEF